ncbi:MAG: XRE family transcriptional regulator [bacterium]
MKGSTALRVKELLREKGWTTKVLAEKTGMSESYLTHIKNGTRRWNEDALRKLADAFEVDPVDVIDTSKNRTDKISTTLSMPKTNSSNVNVHVTIAPIVGKIPAQPSELNNQIAQQETGHEGQFVPVTGYNDPALFCLKVEDSSMAPKFSKGDLLVVAPGEWTNSGDIVAVEYENNDMTVREIKQVNFLDDVVVIESVNHSQAPKPLVRGKDTFRIIGKVVFRYQDFNK